MIIREVLAIIALFLCIFGMRQLAHGKTITSYNCMPVENLSGFVLMNQEQFRFLQAVYVSQLWAPDDLPPGDQAYVKRIGEHAKVLFVDGTLSCAAMMVPKLMLDTLDQIGRNDINHIGAPL